VVGNLAPTYKASAIPDAQQLPLTCQRLLVSHHSVNELQGAGSRCLSLRSLRRQLGLRRGQRLAEQQRVG